MASQMIVVERSYLKSFFGLKNLAESIDKEIAFLDNEVKFGLIENFKSGLSADVADEVLEEFTEMKKEVNGRVQQLTEGVSNMESFLEGVYHNAAEMEDAIKQVENYAAQYGYVPTERKSLEEAYTEFLAAGDNQSSDEHESSVSDENLPRVNASVAKVSRVDATVKNVESPNLLTFGLSKGTLGKLGYRFKEDVTSQKRDGEGVTSHKNIDEDMTSQKRDGARFFHQGEVKHVAQPAVKRDPEVLHPRPEPKVETFNTLESDDDSPVSILKSRHRPANICEKQTPDFSFVEISPGLVVKRPSTRITPKLTELETSGPAVSDSRPSAASGSREEKAATASAAQKSDVISAGGSPQMPVLKTFKWVERTTSAPQQSPTLRQHQQQQEHQLNAADITRPILEYPSIPESESQCITNSANEMYGTPPTPDLRTVDLRKLLRENKPESLVIEKPVLLQKKIGSSPELPDLSAAGRAAMGRIARTTGKENYYN